MPLSPHNPRGVSINYAIVQTGGKQYRVSPGQRVSVEKLDAEEGELIELDQVLMITNDDDIAVGTPTIEGAKVIAEVEKQGKDKKIIVFKYKSKVRYRRKRGHRQPITELLVREIVPA